MVRRNFAILGDSLTILYLAFHNELDVVSVHEGLVQELRSVLVTVRTRQSIDGQVDTIFNAKGSSLAGRTAFTHVSIFRPSHYSKFIK